MVRATLTLDDDVYRKLVSEPRRTAALSGKW
jgi:predicted CopG family antitoxin